MLHFRDIPWLSPVSAHAIAFLESVHSIHNVYVARRSCKLKAATVDYIKMHSVSVHKIGNALEFPGPELGPTQNCLPVHNTKCMLL